MFEVGYSEILVIAIVLIVVVGPKDLPKMLRAFGKATTKFRQMSGDFRKQFDDALKEAELDEVRKTISDVRKLDPRQQVRDALSPLRDAGNALKADLNKAVQPPKPKVEMQPAPVVAIKAASKKPVKKIAEQGLIGATPVASKATTKAKVQPKAPVIQPVSAKTKQAKGKMPK
jgi:sec-independent protein translocase protein TatB